MLLARGVEYFFNVDYIKVSSRLTALNLRLILLLISVKNRLPLQIMPSTPSAKSRAIHTWSQTYSYSSVERMVKSFSIKKRSLRKLIRSEQKLSLIHFVMSITIIVAQQSSSQKKSDRNIWSLKNRLARYLQIMSSTCDLSKFVYCTFEISNFNHLQQTVKSWL